MSDFIERYRHELTCVSCFKDNTVEVYVTSIYRYFSYATAVLGIDPIHPQAGHLTGWIAHLRKSGTSFSRLQTYQVALKSFFRFACKMGAIRHNPAQNLLLIRKNKSTLNQPISVATAYRLLTVFDQSSWIGLRDFTIVSLLWALGLRIGECLALNICDFEADFDSRKKIGTLRVHGKRRKTRTLFVTDRLYQTLSSYMRHPQSPKKKNECLFPTKVRTGKPVSKDRIRRMIKQAAQQAGLIERVTPHVLRHTFATHMYQRGVPPAAISRMLGHDSLEETGLYIHVPEAMKKTALEKINLPEEAPHGMPGT